MEELSRTYTAHVDGFADIAIEITKTGKVTIKSWPQYSVNSDTLCKILRTLADNIEQIKNEQ